MEREAYYAQPGKEMQSTFNLKVPEIYQIELTNACNFGCDFCPRDNPGIRRPDTFITPELARKISERDLGGSYFVEFQLAGEPTLHRDFNDIVAMFRGKVLTGLSTNGSSVHGSWQGLLMLDYLTISIDSVDEYEKVRPGGKWDNLVRNIDFLLNKKAEMGQKYPHIDLQLIEFPGVEKQREKLLELSAKMGWDKHAVVRTIPDCFLSITREMRESRRKELCLNPWMSVSIQADGDVSSCCFSFGKEIVYGNLNDQSLEEIWNTSPELAKFRQEHLTGNYRPICERCYMRSPVLLHWDLYNGAVKERVLGIDQRQRESKPQVVDRKEQKAIFLKEVK